MASWRRPLLALVVVSALLAACGGATRAPAIPPPGTGDGGAAAGRYGLPAVDPLAVAPGSLLAAGSSTLFPLTAAMAERFRDEGFDGAIAIDSVGTGAGFERFCVNAETDIANASRPITPQEAAACERAGRPAVGFRVGTDALAIVVNPSLPIEELTEAQVAAIFSGQVMSWGEIDEAAGSLPISLFSPGSDSGTYDYLVETIFDGDEGPIQGARGIQFSEDDNVLVQGVEGSAGGIGYFGYAYYLENADRLKLLRIEGIAPSAETAERGDYLLSRPLFIYSSPTIFEEKPWVADFVAFYLSFVDEEIAAAGYFPASDEALREAAQQWLDAQP